MRRRLVIKARVNTRSEAAGIAKLPGEAVIVERGIPRLLVLNCPCGCGEEYAVNLDGRSGKAWRMYQDKANQISLFPSVWRDTGCEAHYVIWRGNIAIFGRGSDGFARKDWEWLVPTKQLVSEQMKSRSTFTFVELADELNLIPWDVLEVCRELVQEGHLRAGAGKLEGTFYTVK